MSCRVDTSSLISGACVVGNRGLGVRGDQIASFLPRHHIHQEAIDQMLRTAKFLRDNARRVFKLD